MKRLVLFLVFLFSTAVLMADNVKGRISDAHNQGLGYANVVVLNLPDSSFVSGVVADSVGRFSVDIPSRDVLLKISYVGYKDAFVRPDGSFLEVKLTEDNTSLQEVTVRGQLPKYIMSAEGVSTSVEGTLLSKLGTASDVLKHVPGVVKKDKTWEVFGRGECIVYLNNRRLQNFDELDELNSSDIKSVEVIRNPGAKYDASVKAVIRIKTRKVQGEGLGFNNKVTYWYNGAHSANDQLDITYRHKGLNVYGMYKYNRVAWMWKSILDQVVNVDTLWQQHNRQDNKGVNQNHQLRAGFSYDINDNHSLGMRYSAYIRGKRDDENGWIDGLVKANGTFYDYIFSTLHADNRERPTHALNVYYIGKVGKTGIDFNVDWYRKHDITFTETNENSQNYDSRVIQSESSVIAHMLASKLVLSTPLLGGKAEYGAEYINTYRNSTYHVNRTDIVSNADNEIRERSVCPFVEYSHTTPIGEIRLGMRYEYINFKYYDAGKLISEQSRKYHNFYPSFHYSTQIGKTSWQLSYSAKVRRPSYNQLSNEVLYANRFTRQSGNPTLRHETDHSVSLAGTWKFVQLSLDYTDARNAIIYWTEQDANNQSITTVKFKNEPTIKTLTSSISAAPTIGFWSPQLTLSLQKQRLSLYTSSGVVKLNKPILQIMFNNGFKLPWGITANLDYTFTGKGDIQNNYLSRVCNVLEAGLSKGFLKDALTIELKGYDLLYQDRNYEFMYCEKMTLYQEGRRHSRDVTLTVRYNFNPSRSKYKGTGAGNSERNRL